MTQKCVYPSIALYGTIREVVLFSRFAIEHAYLQPTVQISWFSCSYHTPGSHISTPIAA